MVKQTEVFIAWKAAKMQYRKLVKQAKEQFWRDLCAEVEVAEGTISSLIKIYRTGLNRSRACIRLGQF